MWSGICLVTVFLWSGIKKKWGGENADQVEAHSRRLLADRVMNKNLPPGVSASRTDGASDSNPESNLSHLITTLSPFLFFFFLKGPHKDIHTAHNKGMWNCLLHKSQIHDNLFPISGWPTAPVSTSACERCLKKKKKKLRASTILQLYTTSKQHYARLCNTKSAVHPSAAHNHGGKSLTFESPINKKDPGAKIKRENQFKH